MNLKNRLKNQKTVNVTETILIHSGLAQHDDLIYGSLYRSLDGRTFVSFITSNDSCATVEMKNGIIDYPNLAALGAVSVSASKSLTEK